MMINEEEILEEEVLEKDRSAEDKRKRDWRKAISRFNLIRSLFERTTSHSLGYYRNNNEANANTCGSRKTNTRNASGNYRHKGGYGKAKKYSPHDQRQLDDMAEDINENS